MEGESGVWEVKKARQEKLSTFWVVTGEVDEKNVWREILPLQY